MATRALELVVKGYGPASVPRSCSLGSIRHPATLRTCKLMNIGCLNIRTLLDLQTSHSRPECRSALVAKELQRYATGIVALSETRLANEGQFAE